MLRHLIVNQKRVPIPVPLLTLADVCTWVDDILVPVGETVTSAYLDEKDILDLWASPKATAVISLRADSRLDIRIESSEDLALQSLDAIHSLAGAILRGIKMLAVHLWQARQNEAQPELFAVRDDLGLICELMDRMNDLGLSSAVDLVSIRELHARIYKISLCLDAAVSVGDWKASAQILLRDTSTAIGLETSLRHLVDESESNHLRLLTSRSSKSRVAKISCK
jgi:hypothetical protein